MTPFMPPTLAEGGTQILFLAEAPGKSEDTETGRPLTGPSGKLLRECIPAKFEDYCSFDNTINCRPENNRAPTWQEIECFPGDTKVVPLGKIKTLYKRWYDGPVIMLKTRMGNVITGTPNHPVFVGECKIPLRLIKAGDYLLNANGGDFCAPTYPNVNNVPARIDEIFGAFAKTFEIDGVEGGPFNFHGDGKFSQVDIIRADSQLLCHRDAFVGEKVEELNLTSPNPRAGSLMDLGTFDANLAVTSMVASSSGGIWPVDCVPQRAGFRATPDGFTPTQQSFPYGVLRHAEFDGKLGSGSPLPIEGDEVVSVSISQFSGHVYNLETESGSYLANGIKVGNCCRPRRWKVIEEAKPKLIVGLGAVPLQWMMGTIDIGSLRGRLIAVKVGSHKCWFLPTYHPSFILRVAFDKKKPLKSKMGHCFKMDLRRAFSVVNKLKPPIIEPEGDIKLNIQCFDGTDPRHFDRVVELLGYAKKAPHKAIDLETRFLRPHTEGAALLSVAFSFSGTNFAFALDHPKAGWSKQQRDKLVKIIADIVSDDTIKVSHNAVFEIEWLIWLCGREVVNHGAWECTMMQAHHLDERKGAHRDESTNASKYHGLNYLLQQHFGILNFKGLFKVDKKDMARTPLPEMLIYNSGDTKYTLRLWERQTQLLHEAGLHNAYLEALPRQPTVALMQSIGVPIDQVEIKRLQKGLGGEITALEAEIQSLNVVKAYVKERGEFNPLSVPHAVTIFRDYLHHPTAAESVNKHTLGEIDHPLAALIVTLRNKVKMKSTYVDGLEQGVGKIIYPDSRLHTSFNTCATTTGRLSSDAPNLQNWPKRDDNWARKPVVPPPGHLMVAVDYGQLEACTGAMCSRDAHLVKALWDDYDIHMEWAIKGARKHPEMVGGTVALKDKVVLKKFRSLIKNKLVFPAFFGATAESICGYLTAATHCEVPLHKVEALLDEFWDTFHDYKTWQDDTMTRYYDIGHVETMLGRRRHYPLTRNEAINMPVQGTAAELVCDAMNRLSYIAASTGQWHLHPVLNIHDDITLFIPDSGIIFEEAIEAIVYQMLTFDFAWVNVPLSVEVSVGKNWAEMESIGKFWSHKEFGYPKRIK